MDIINDQFNQFNSFLDQQESRAKANFGEAKGLYDEQLASGEKRYGEQRQTQTENVKKTEALNLKKVRGLLRDLSQSDAARIAIYGGGSTSEALGARFGREAQSRLGNVTEQSAQALQRVNAFYDDAIQKLNDSYQSNILQAKQSLDANLANIAGQRTASAAAKQNATLDAWRSYYDNVNQAKIQAATFKAQYDLWKQQQDNAYAAVAPFNQQNTGLLSEGVQRSLTDLSGTPAQPVQQTGVNPYYRFNQLPSVFDDDEDKDVFKYNTDTGFYRSNVG